MKTKTKLWRIYLPANDNNGFEFSLEHHQKWDEYVHNLVGGVTIMKSAKGQWISPHGKLYIDIMIPCEINCFKSQIKQIARFSIEHYNQEAIAYLPLSRNMKIMKKII